MGLFKQAMSSSGGRRAFAYEADPPSFAYCRMDYNLWTQVAPRSPIGRINAV